MFLIKTPESLHCPDRFAMAFGISGALFLPTSSGPVPSGLQLGGTTAARRIILSSARGPLVLRAVNLASFSAT